jgi:Zn-dependent protease with chaperone function
LAEQKFQELGREAQNALQIPVARQVAIKVLPDSDVGVRIATASRSAIYIDQEALSNFSYGYQRAVFFHEAAHVKYGDNSLLVETAIKSALFLSGSISSAVMSTRLSHNISPRISVLLFGAGTVASGFAARQLDLDSWAGKRRERRADVQAYSAMQCDICMQECAQDQQSRGIAKGAAWVQKNRDYGYITPEEMMTIADYFKKQNKVCAYHSKNQIIPSKL